MTDLSDFSVPWHGVTYTAMLDLGYYTHSAQKLISPMVFDISGNIDNIMADSALAELTAEQRTKIAGTIFQIFNPKWRKLWELYEVEYSPIENYTMTENERIDTDTQRERTDTGTVSNADTGTIQDARTEGGTRTITTDTDTTNTGTSANQGTEGGTKTTVTDTDTTNTGTQQNAGSSDTLDGIFGFNSSTSVGSNTSENTNTNTRTDNLSGTVDTTETETRNLTNSNTRTDNLASTEDTTEQETRNLTDNNTRTLNTNELETRNLAGSETVEQDTVRSNTRHGTTGIFTPQQLISQEIELWQWNFYKQVFEDIDSILCLSIY